MLSELIAAVKDLDADEDVAGLVITGKENFFSAGVDLIELYGYNEAQSKAFWHTLLEAVATLAAFKKPFVSSITGHSPAGGCSRCEKSSCLALVLFQQVAVAPRHRPWNRGLRAPA